MLCPPPRPPPGNRPGTRASFPRALLQPEVGSWSHALFSVLTSFRLSTCFEDHTTFWQDHLEVGGALRFSLGWDPGPLLEPAPLHSWGPGLWAVLAHGPTRPGLAHALPRLPACKLRGPAGGRRNPGCCGAPPPPAGPRPSHGAPPPAPVPPPPSFPQLYCGLVSSPCLHSAPARQEVGVAFPDVPMKGAAGEHIRALWERRVSHRGKS